MAGTPSYIQMPVDGSGKQVQAWSNSISGNTVYAEAVVIVDSTGTEKATSGNPLRIDPTGTTVQPVLDGSSSATASAVPADASYVGFNSSGDLVGVSSSTPLPVQVENASAITVVSDSTGTASLSAASWTSATTVNTALTVLSNSFTYTSALIQLSCDGSLGTGVVTIEGSIDNSNWEIVPYYLLNSGLAAGLIVTTGVYSNFPGSLTVELQVPLTNLPYLRVRLSTVITGSHTLTIGYTLQTNTTAPFLPVLVGNSSLVVTGAAGNGATLSGNPVLIAGSDGTAARNIATDTGGQVKVLVENSPAVTITSGTITTVSTVTAVTAITDALPEGSNIIGYVELIDVGGTHVATVKAANTAAAITDTALVVSQNPLSQSQVIGYMMDSTGVQRAISQVAFSSATSGAHTLVAASGSTKVYILSWWVSNGATANGVNLQSHTTTGITTGVVNMAVNGGAVFSPNNGSWITGASGEAIDFNLTGSSQVNGGATYCQF